MLYIAICACTCIHTYNFYTYMVFDYCCQTLYVYKKQANFIIFIQLHNLTR